MEKVINVLIFEEKEAAFQHLKQHCLNWAPNCLITRADGRKALESRMKWMSYNLVLAGYGQPSFSAIDLLFYLKDVHAHCPLVFILDASIEYSSSDTAIMKHAAACLYKADFQRNSFLMEEVMLKAKTKLGLKLASERALLEAVIRRGREEYDSKENQCAKSLRARNGVAPGDDTFQLVSGSVQYDSSVPALGNQDSDTTGVGGESAACQPGGSTR